MGLFYLPKPDGSKLSFPLKPLPPINYRTEKTLTLRGTGGNAMIQGVADRKGKRAKAGYGGSVFGFGFWLWVRAIA